MVHGSSFTHILRACLLAFAQLHFDPADDVPARKAKLGAFFALEKVPASPVPQQGISRHTFAVPRRPTAPATVFPRLTPGDPCRRRV